MIQIFTAVLALLAPQVPTTQYSHGDPTDDEQYVLEVINRARANPAEEGKRLGGIDITADYPSGTLSPVGARPPLAMNSRLREAARKHCEAMYNDAFFAHDNPITGSTPGSRITAEGYVWNKCGENIAAGGNSSAAALEDMLMIDDKLAGRGHRVNLLDITTGSYYREIGIYYYQGASAKTINIDGTDYQLKDFMTQDFGRSSDGPFLVGVVYNDANSNGFYDPGEGIVNARVMPSAGTYYANTSASGGYAIPMQAIVGPVLVTISGQGITSVTLQVTLNGTDNAKLDLDTAAPPASVDDDSDGMPNAWETQYGLNPADPADAAQDADGDGYTNLQEYQAGTDPTNPASNPGGGGGGGGYTGDGYYDANGVFVGFPAGVGAGSTGEGTNGDDGANDTCAGSVGAPGAFPWAPLAAVILLLARRRRRSA